MQHCMAVGTHWSQIPHAVDTPRDAPAGGEGHEVMHVDEVSADVTVDRLEVEIACLANRSIARDTGSARALIPLVCVHHDLLTFTLEMLVRVQETFVIGSIRCRIDFRRRVGPLRSRVRCGCGRRLGVVAVLRIRCEGCRRVNSETLKPIRDLGFAGADRRWTAPLRFLEGIEVGDGHACRLESTVGADATHIRKLIRRVPHEDGKHGPMRGMHLLVQLTAGS